MGKDSEDRLGADDHQVEDEDETQPLLPICRLSAAEPRVRLARHSPASQQVSPRQASRPSRTASAAMPTAASGSAHHQPAVALRPRPTRRIAERYEHSAVSVESATITAFPNR